MVRLCVKDSGALPYLEGKNFEGRKIASVERTTASTLNRPAPRPTFSAFDTSKITNLLGRPPMRWDDALDVFLREIGVE
jgi:dTDP-4-dehydrorhamnose reductase